MHRIPLFSVAGVLILALAQIGGAQEDQAQKVPLKIEASSQPAVATLRAIARALGACPPTVDDETKWGKEPWDISQMMDGPPTNVVWDVAPSQSVRSPYAGYIEFSAYYRFSVQPENRDNFERKRPKAYSALLMGGKDWKYRYEFDLGPEGVELVRSLDRGLDQTQWRDIRKRNPCWQNALRNTLAKSEK
jgi:hypothetical protein